MQCRNWVLTQFSANDANEMRYQTIAAKEGGGTDSLVNLGLLVLY